MTKEILPCVAINTSFGEIRCPPHLTLPGEDLWECELHPTVIDTHDDRFNQIGAVIWADLFSVIIEVEFLDTTYNSLSLKSYIIYYLPWFSFGSFLHLVSLMTSQ